MDTESIRKNFEDQLLQTEKQITDLETNLAKAKDYRLKLQGGIETLNLLENPPSETTSSEEVKEE